MPKMVIAVTANIVEAAALIGAKNWIKSVNYIAPPTNYREWCWAAEEYILKAKENN